MTPKAKKELTRKMNGHVALADKAYDEMEKTDPKDRTRIKELQATWKRHDALASMNSALLSEHDRAAQVYGEMAELF